MNMVQRVLRHIGINAERLLLEWVSAAEGVRFAEVVTGLTEKLKQLGPLAADAGNRAEDLRLKLQAARNAVAGEKLRWVAAKQTEFMKDGNKYGELFTAHETGRFLDGVIVEEIALQQILILLARQPLSVRELAQGTGLEPSAVLRFVLSLQRKGQVAVADIRDRAPRYTVVQQAA